MLGDLKPAMTDEIIERIVSGSSRDAMSCLLSVVGEALSVWANLEVGGKCDARCKNVLSMSRLERLHQALCSELNISLPLVIRYASFDGAQRTEPRP